MRNKKRYLESLGWNVCAFSSPHIWGMPIVLEELKVFKKNTLKELAYRPTLFSKRQRKNIINKILAKIPMDSAYVVESNQFILAEWGEILAKTLTAQHIIFNLNEKNVIIDSKVYDFLRWKLNKNEFFAISAKACQNLFSKFYDVKDAENHFWRAASANEVDDVFVKQLEGLQKADYNIGYFGRYKSFMPYVFETIACFAKRHCTDKINLIIVGFNKINAHDIDLLNVANINVVCIDTITPIPRSFFDKTDVVIATAGCASISYKQGAKTISMSVEEDKALGLLGYTTNALSYAAGFEVDGRELLELLEVSLIGGDVTKRVDTSFLDTSAEDKYKLQLLAIKEPLAIKESSDYYDVATLSSRHNVSNFIKKTLIRLGFVSVMFDVKSLKARICR